MSDKIFIVCMPTNELPVPPGPASHTYCQQCHTLVWIADSTPRSPEMNILCCNCAIIEMLADDDVSIINRNQLLTLFNQRTDGA